MTKFLRQAALFLLTENCLEQYFEKYDFLHGECFKSTLSKALGIAIISGSLLVKVPQVAKLLQNKSSKGINVYSVLLDLFAITSMVSYSFISGFPFSSWGDGIFLGLQTLAIAVLVMHYSGNSNQAAAFFGVYLAVTYAAMRELIPVNILWSCQAMNIPIILISKLMQAYTNYSNGSTGQLSAATCFMLFFGSLARIFTSIQETGDKTMILMYICSTSANAVIAGQLLYYWHAIPKKSLTKESKKSQ
ncbi:mannose-P-dolichol utilization defect 1 protein homolog [Prorops nasuta]|uniref:mannose-P-dolichol utilization defect 1 protein homolog n=1 Tax=Prorops nasuta TaxID=863751 RepID=UPI0034CD4FA7